MSPTDVMLWVLAWVVVALGLMVVAIGLVMTVATSRGVLLSERLARRAQKIPAGRLRADSACRHIPPAVARLSVTTLRTAGAGCC